MIAQHDIELPGLGPGRGLVARRAVESATCQPGEGM